MIKYRKLLVFGFIGAFLLVLLAINLRVISAALLKPERIEGIIRQSLGTRAKIGKIDFNIWRGIKISNVSFLTTTKAQAEAPILNVKSIRLVPDKTELLRGKFRISEVTLKGPELFWSPQSIADWVNSIISSTGKSSLNINLPSEIQELTGVSPKIIIRDGLIHIHQPSIFRTATDISLRDTNITLYPISAQRYIIEGVAKVEFICPVSAEHISGAATANNPAGQPFLLELLVSGEINRQTNMLQLKLDAHDVNINESLAEKLSPKYQEHWQHYQLKGPVNLQAGFSYNLSTHSPDFNILIDCMGDEMAYIGFPYKFSDVRGQINFTKTTVYLRNLSGTDNRTASRCALDGIVSGYGADAGFEINLRTNKLVLDDKLFQALPPNLKDIWNKLKIKQGSVDLNGTIHRAAGINLKESYTFKVSSHGLAATPSYFPYSVSDADADIDITVKEDASAEVKIKSLVASRETTGSDAAKPRINLSGHLFETKNALSFSLSIDAQGIETNDYALKEAVKKYAPDAEKLWSAYQPQGLVNLKATVSNTGDTPGTNVQLTVECHNNPVKLPPEYHPVTISDGRIEYSSNAQGIHLKQMKIISADNTFDLEGTVTMASSATPAEEAMPSTFDLTIKSSQLIMNNQLFKLFPESIGNFLRDIDFKGNAGLSAKLTSSAQTEQKQGITDYQAEIKLSNGQLQAGIGLSDISGLIALKGQYNANTQQGHTAGSIQFSYLKLEGKQLSNVAIHLLKENNRINFYNINGSAYDGVVSGFLGLTLPPEGASETDKMNYQYYGRFNLVGVNLASLSRDMAMGNSSGKLSAELAIKGQGTSGAAAPWRSANTNHRGDLTIEGKASVVDAQLWELPIFLSILNLFSLTEKPIFTEGEMRFQLKDGVINAHRLVFTSKSVSLKGKGTIKLDGTLDLQLATYFASSFLPKIFNDIKNLFVEGIYTIKIEGTLKEPKAYPKPLPILDIFK